MPKFGNLRTQKALATGKVNLLVLDYQPISDWLKHVEAKYGKPVAELCEKKISALGLRKTDCVNQLPRDHLKIIGKARQELAPTTP
ncbi:MAG: hypothetical protein WC250_01015 [Candidatus Paceibacterota bacterium]|jgi:hypothetical protein